jgi:hypothetical protein
MSSRFFADRRHAPPSDRHLLIILLPRTRYFIHRASQQSSATESAREFRDPPDLSIEADSNEFVDSKPNSNANPDPQLPASAPRLSLHFPKLPRSLVIAAAISAAKCEPRGLSAVKGFRGRGEGRTGGVNTLPFDDPR